LFVLGAVKVRAGENMLIFVLAAYLACSCLLFFFCSRMDAQQSKFSPKTWVRSGLETLLVGSVCALVAFVLGDLVSGLVGEGWQI
jgi:hypothetical protein